MAKKDAMTFSERITNIVGVAVIALVTLYVRRSSDWVNGVLHLKIWRRGDFLALLDTAVWFC